MLNLLRSDFYKLSKAKYFWICLIVNIVLAAGSIFMLDFVYKMTGEQLAVQAEQQASAMNEAGINASVKGIPSSYEDLNASTQMVGYFAGNTTLLIAVLIALFVGSEFNNGTIKNIASKNYSRNKIYASKLLTCIIAGVLFCIIYAAVSTITATALWGFGDVLTGFWPDFFKGAGLELLLNCAYVSIFVMFTILIRQNGGSLAANICFLEFISLAVMLGEMLIKKISGQTITLSNYLLDTNMQAVSANLTRDIALRSLCVAAGFFLVSSAVGFLNFRHRDIK